MTRRKRKSGKPHGGGGARNPNSLANLIPNRGAAGPGNTRALTHGAYAKIDPRRLEPRECEVRDAIAADAPLRNPDGSLPAADAVLVSLLASCLIRLEGIAGYLRDHGLLDADGNPRGVIETEAKLRREAADHAEALGMSPRARAKIGLDLIRAADAAEDAEANREARERLDRRLEALDGFGGPPPPAVQDGDDHEPPNAQHKDDYGECDVAAVEEKSNSEGDEGHTEEVNDARPEWNKHHDETGDDHEHPERHVDPKDESGNSDGDPERPTNEETARVLHSAHGRSVFPEGPTE